MNCYRRIYSLLVIGLTAFFLSCSDKNNDSLHSAYYWTTTFKMSEPKAEFIKKHDVKRLYMRFFDVVMDPYDKPMPNATIEFIDTIPDSLEIVPTVYVMNECMGADIDDLADKVTKRILQMCETHHIRNVHEIQIDCDWTRRTQDRYFAFLENVRNRLKEKEKSLSATIRLHQLSMSVPPVDRGALMVYNTGDVRKYGGTNPILDKKDAVTYIRYLSDYELPLATAYPVFSWRVLFRDKHFIGILHTDDELPVLAEDTIVEYEPTLDVVMQAKQAVGRERKDANDEVILFDISETNIQRINNYQYEKDFLN